MPLNLGAPFPPALYVYKSEGMLINLILQNSTCSSPNSLQGQRIDSANYPPADLGRHVLVDQDNSVGVPVMAQWK